MTTETISPVSVEELLAKATGRPWVYRPLPYDDWGVVRGGPDLMPVARASISRFDEAVLDEHRRRKSDPVEGVARLIAAAPEIARAYLASEARVRELEKALRSFVRHYAEWMDSYPDKMKSSVYPDHTFGDIRRARAVLASRPVLPAEGESDPDDECGTPGCSDPMCPYPHDKARYSPPEASRPEALSQPPSPDAVERAWEQAVEIEPTPAEELARMKVRERELFDGWLKHTAFLEEKVAVLEAGIEARAVLSATGQGEAVAPEPVAIQPLEWETTHTSNGYGDASKRFWRAETPWGGYIWIEMHHSTDAYSGRCVLGPKLFDTVNEAKAAAQADYEQRIRSALAAPPPPASQAEVRRAALEEAARVVEQHSDAVDCVVHVPAGNDITSMGRPYRTEPYDYKTTRPATRKDYAATIRSLPSHEEGADNAIAQKALIAQEGTGK